MYLLVPLVAVIWWFGHTRFGYSYIDNFTTWLVTASVLAFVFYTLGSELKERTSKLIANDFHTTTDGQPYDAGDYLVYTIGDIDYGVHLKGGSGAVIVPRKSVTYVGKNVISTCRIGRVTFDNLPSIARKVIADRNIPGPYFHGFFDAKTELQFNEVQDVANELLGLRAQNTVIQRLMKGDFAIIEDAIQHGKLVVDTARGESFVNKMKKAIAPSSEE